MVAIGMSAGSVAQVRFAISCLWEVVASLRVLRDPGGHAVHFPWVRRVQPDLQRKGLIGSPSSLLWELVPREPRYLPDFLTPAPTGLSPTLASELSVLVAQPSTVVRADLSSFGVTPELRPLYDDPARGLAELAGQIEAYWEIAIADDWPRIQVLSEGDILGRARQSAEHGTAAMLNSLHERVRWADGALSVRQPHCTADNLSDGGGLTLVPSVFVWPTVLTVSTGTMPQIAYPPRGLATLWENRPHSADSLAAIVGRNRARLLIEMATPVSTTELARRTGITAGGVSQHLSVLRAAGLVATHRHGRSVLNARTPAADVLVSAAPDHPRPSRIQP